MNDSNEKIACRTPTSGKASKRIDKWKYDLLRKAILASLSTKEPGVLFTELFDLVEARLTPKQREEIGSIPWYTTTVKLELEVSGEIARVVNAAPQRLVKRKAK